MSGTISFSKGLADVNSITSPSSRYTSCFNSNDAAVAEKKLCTTCNEYIEISTFRAHFKTEWHRYNMYRKQNQLQPVDLEMFLTRKEIAKQQALVVNQKGQDHKKHKSQPIPSNSTISGNDDTSLEKHTNGGNADVAKIKIKEIKYVSGMNIFNAKMFNSPEDALKNMYKNNGFYLPESEYITNLAGLLDYLGNIVFTDNVCLYCGKMFSTIYAVWHHMEAKGHQKISYDMIEEICQFYDFTPSYAELLKTRDGVMRVINYDLIAHGVAAELAHASDDEWEDVSDDDGNCEIIKPDYTESQVLRELSKYNLKPAFIDENNNLTLPDGREVVHRSAAYVYKQFLRPTRAFNNGSLLVSKLGSCRLSRRDFKGKISGIRDQIRQNIHKDVRSYKLFKIRSQNIIFN